MQRKKACFCSKICFAAFIIIFLVFFSSFAEAGGGGRRRGGGGCQGPCGSPGCSPCPCPIQSAGCYKIGDAKAGFGELGPADFGYFLPENKCKRSGGCDCKGVPEDIPQETNPDDSSGACNCIAGTDFNAKAKCCGDDTEDCGRISSGVLCSIDANAESAQWLPSTPNLGDIRFVGCSRREYLSDGVNWIKCDGTFWRRTVGNSEYVCIGTGRESVVECCGDGSCKSRIDGKRLSTGQSINNDPTTGSSSFKESLVNVEIELTDASQSNIKKLTDKGVIVNKITTEAIKSITGDAISAINSNEQTKQSTSDKNYSSADLASSESYYIPFLKSKLFSDFIPFVEAQESPGDSPTDSPIICGNGICGDETCKIPQMGPCLKWETESCSTCPQDCGSCPLQNSNIKSPSRIWISATVHIDKIEDIKKIDFVKSVKVTGPAPPSRQSTTNSDQAQVASITSSPPSPLSPPSQPSSPASTDSIGSGADSQSAGSGSGSGESPSAERERIISQSKTHPTGTCKRIKKFGDNIGILVPYNTDADGFERIYPIISKKENIKAPNYGSVLELGGGGGQKTCGGINDIKCPEGYECVFSTATGNVVASESITGNVVAGQEGKTFYCRTDRRFITDLDVPNSQKSDKTLIGKNKATCEKAGFTWTGTKCCSEDDDPNENYNDPAGKGGCFDKNPVISISFAEGTEDSVVNFNGEFHGCAIEKTNFNKNNDNLLTLADKHTGAALITNHDYCFNDPEKNYYCSYTEKWIQTDGTDKTHASFAPVQNPKQAADCCAAEECWDGEKCIENQKDDPLAQPTGSNSRCIDGEWTESELRVTVDDGASGFCPKKSQCLANVFGKDIESQCFEPGEYFDDNLCENGVWSTRTKLLAMKLLEMKSGDFALSCDDKENTLNNLQYLTDSNAVATNILSSLKSNNFCVLKTGSKIVAATSINKNLSEITGDSLNIFGVKSCDDALIDDGQYHPCDATKKVWLNKKLGSFIYSAEAITVPSGQDSSGSFSEFIGNPIRNIIDSIKRLVTTPPFDESYLKEVKKFDKIYLSQEDGKTVRGTVEGAKFKNAVIEYSGFDVDVCKFLDQFSEAKKDVSSGIACKKERNTFYVLVQGSQFTNVNPETIWPDLTSKLRLK